MSLLSSLKNESSSYSLEFELITAETYVSNAWDGWLSYELILCRNTDIISKCTGAIIDDDVKGFAKCFLVESRKTESLEPMEPDFVLCTSRFDSEVTVHCFIDEGHASDGIYSDSGLGIKFNVDDLSARKFANEIKHRFNQLTNDLVRSE